MSWTEDQARALAAVFDALDAAGIDWMVLRNHQGLPKANRSKDVDLGLDKLEFRRAEQVIAEASKKNGFQRMLAEDFQYVRCLTFFNFQGEKPLSIKIDLLDGFVYRGAQVFHFRNLLTSARRDNGFLIPSVVDDAAMLWLKPLITGGIVKSKYVPDIRSAAQNDPTGFKRVLDDVLTPKWAGLAWSRIETDDIAGTVKMKSGLRRSAWWRAFSRNPLATLRDAAHHVISELVRRSRRPPGAFLAVLGPDGAGKTTFITTLRDRLAALQVKDPDAIELRHFRPHLLPNINQLLTGQTETVGEFNNPHSAPPAGRMSSILRIGYYSLDYICGYWLQLRRRMIGGRTILFDRYFYDFHVDPRRSRLSLPAWVTKFFLMTIPKPDLVFVLEAPVDDIYRRKQELPRDEIERQLGVYRKLAAGEPSRFLCIDARQSPDTMVDTALCATVKRLYRVA